MKRNQPKSLQQHQVQSTTPMKFPYFNDDRDNGEIQTTITIQQKRYDIVQSTVKVEGKIRTEKFIQITQVIKCNKNSNQKRNT